MEPARYDLRVDATEQPRRAMLRAHRIAVATLCVLILGLGKLAPIRLGMILPTWGLAAIDGFSHPRADHARELQWSVTVRWADGPPAIQTKG